MIRKWCIAHYALIGRTLTIKESAVVSYTRI
nr:MAG TPA: hypothetical protein [Caudoviricetes sp.]